MARARPHRKAAHRRTAFALFIRNTSFERTLKPKSGQPSRLDDKLHIHLLVVFAANYRADHDVLAGLGRSTDRDIMRAGLEQKVPTIHGFAVRSAEQRETVDGAIPIAIFGFYGGDAQGQRFSGFRDDYRLRVTGN